MRSYISGGNNVIHDFWYLGKGGWRWHEFIFCFVLLTYLRSVFIKHYSDSMCFSSNFSWKLRIIPYLCCTDVRNPTSFWISETAVGCTATYFIKIQGCFRWYCQPHPLIWDSVLLYLQSPKGGWCSISDDWSCSHKKLSNSNLMSKLVSTASEWILISFDAPYYTELPPYSPKTEIENWVICPIYPLYM